jgi:superoxide reductase
MKIYYCPICKNLTVMVNDSGVNPVCCGKPMVALTANTTDAAVEKHVPAVNVNGDIVEVVVGDVIHPMLPEHHIDFVILETNKGKHIHHLDKAGEPKTKFKLADGETPIAVYEYCNLHGLWKKEL